MTLPVGYDLPSWFNDIVGRLNNTNAEFAVLRKYWNSLTTAQKNALKSSTNATIDVAIADLTAIKADITAVP
jgi:hypothetical protein